MRTFTTHPIQSLLAGLLLAGLVIFLPDPALATVPPYPAGISGNAIIAGIIVAAITIVLLLVFDSKRLFWPKVVVLFFIIAIAGWVTFSWFTFRF